MAGKQPVNVVCYVSGEPTVRQLLQLERVAKQWGCATSFHARCFTFLKQASFVECERIGALVKQVLEQKQLAINSQLIPEVNDHE